MKTKAMVWLFVAAAIGAAPSVGQDMAGRKARLAAELELAKTPHVYLVIATEAREISLRVRGMTLKTWVAADLRAWGRPAGVTSLKLAKRTGWSAQDRINLTPGIKPEAKKDDKPQDIGADVLELEDMPVRYAFLMENGLKIVIKPKPKGILGKTGGAFAGIGQVFGRSAKAIWSAIRGREFSELRILFKAGKDAQSIFWSTPEGTSILFY
jgi:hypothetical protein